MGVGEVKKHRYRAVGIVSAADGEVLKRVDVKPADALYSGDGYHGIEILVWGGVCKEYQLSVLRVADVHMERDIVLHVDAGRGFQLVIAHVRGDLCRNVGRSSGDQLRHFAENAELSAAGKILFKKRYRAFVKRLAVWDDHLVIEAEPDPELISLNASHVLHDALVTEMI